MNRFFKSLAAVLALTAVADAAGADEDDPRWVVDPDTLASPFGEDDERGAANRLTSESVLEALELVRSGETISLATPLSRETPA